MRTLGARDGGLDVGVVAWGALFAAVLMVEWVAAGPIDTSDFWFHARAGETYASEGPWPEADPMLHTAHAEAPVQHEWLFGVAMHAMDVGTGLGGVRVLHGVAVLAIVLAAVAVLRRARAPTAWTALAATVFLLLAWPRLVQMRPDLVSILATLGLTLLLFEGRDPPSWRRVAAAAFVAFLWANFHSLYGLAPALVVAALLGVLLHAAALKSARLPGAPLQWRRAKRLALAGLAIIGAGLLNPRGFDQHLTFFSSSSEFGIWDIADEWFPFNPFVLPSALAGGAPVGDLAWALTDGLYAAAITLAIFGVARFAWRRRACDLRTLDPLYLGLAAASAVAILVSVRFLWMGIFPLLFLLRFAAQSEEGLTPRRRGTAMAAGLVALLLVAALAFDPGYRARLSRLPDSLSGYFSESRVRHGTYEPGIRFLQEAALEGNLYNRYTMGGLLGYRLAPRLRTFVDGRTEHYPSKVLADYFRIAHRREVDPGETALEALDRYGVDVFFGVGFPALGEHIYTTAHLEGVPGWLPIFRGPGHALYLRDSERNRENLGRVARFYASEGVPFDLRRGFEIDAVLREASGWLIDRGLLPAAYPQWLRDRGHADPARRFEALDRMGAFYALLGAYDLGAEADHAARALQPVAKAPLRRLVYGALRQDRGAEALLQARRLLALDRTDPRSQAFFRAARAVHGRAETESGEAFARRRALYREARRDRGAETPPEQGWLVPRAALVDSLPLLDASEREACCKSFD